MLRYTELIIRKFYQSIDKIFLLVFSMATPRIIISSIITIEIIYFLFLNFVIKEPIATRVINVSIQLTIVTNIFKFLLH